MLYTSFLWWSKSLPSTVSRIKSPDKLLWYYHRENGGTLGMFILKINPSGYWSSISPFERSPFWGGPSIPRVHHFPYDIRSSGNAQLVELLIQSRSSAKFGGMIFWSLNLGKNVRLRCCPWSRVCIYYIFVIIDIICCVSMFDIVSWVTHQECHLRYVVYLKWTSQSFTCQAKTMR